MSYVTVSRTSDSTSDTTTRATWVAKKPDGTTIDTSASTTDGLQEAVDYACMHGHALRVWGGCISTITGENPAIMMLTSPLIFPTLEMASIEFIGVTLNFCGDNPQPEAICFDSCMASRIIFSGQVVCSPGWGIGIALKPRNILASDHGAGAIITASHFELPSVVMLGAGMCIDFDARAGGISGNTWEILEPNGGTVGINVRTSTSTCFDHNVVVAREIHGSVSGIVAGTLSHGATCFGNTWFATIMPLSVGAEIFGHHEQWVISIDDREAIPACGFTLNPGAAHNVIDVLMNDAACKVNPASGNLTNVITMP